MLPKYSWTMVLRRNQKLCELCFQSRIPMTLGGRGSFSKSKKEAEEERWKPEKDRRCQVANAGTYHLSQTLLDKSGRLLSQREKKSSWNLALAYSDILLILSLWISRYTSNHSSAHSWLFRTLSQCVTVTNSQQQSVVQTCWLVCSQRFDWIHPPLAPWSIIVHRARGGCIPRGLYWHFLIFYCPFCRKDRKTDIITSSWKLWLWLIMEQVRRSE